MVEYNNGQGCGTLIAGVTTAALIAWGCISALRSCVVESKNYADDMTNLAAAAFAEEKRIDETLDDLKTGQTGQIGGSRYCATRQKDGTFEIRLCAPSERTYTTPSVPMKSFEGRKLSVLQDYLLLYEQDLMNSAPLDKTVPISQKYCVHKESTGKVIVTICSEPNATEKKPKAPAKNPIDSLLTTVNTGIEQRIGSMKTGESIPVPGGKYCITKQDEGLKLQYCEKK